MNLQKIKIGKFWFYHDIESEPGAKQLAHGINYERHVRLELERLIPSAKCFLDIGANAGIHSVNAKDINPNVHVVAVEVSYKNVMIMCNTIIENSFDRFDVFPVAVNTSSGVIGTGDIDNCCVAINNPSSCIDKWPCHSISKFNIPIPDVVKIDVEGVELHALKAIDHLIYEREHLPSIILEYCPINMKPFGILRHEPLEFLQTRGYKFTMIDVPDGKRKTFTDYRDFLEHFDNIGLVITDILADE